MHQISMHQISCASNLQHMHQISCTKSLCTKSPMPQISYASDFSLCTNFLRICTKSLIVPQISHASNLPCTKSLIVHQISVHQISHAPNCMHQIGFTKSDSPNFPAPNRIERIRFGSIFPNQCPMVPLLDSLLDAIQSIPR